MDEVWASILEFDRYLVSNLGRVKNQDSGRVLAIQRNQQGSMFVTLKCGSKPKVVGIARLVATAFVDSSKHVQSYSAPYDTPMHLDGDRSNNEAINLVWRPRWFAIIYQQQFPLLPDSQIPRVDKPIIEETTNQVFANSWDAARHFGVRDKDVWESWKDETVCYLLPLHFRAFY